MFQKWLGFKILRLRTLIYTAKNEEVHLFTRHRICNPPTTMSCPWVQRKWIKCKVILLQTCFQVLIVSPMSEKFPFLDIYLLIWLNSPNSLPLFFPSCVYLGCNYLYRKITYFCTHFLNTIIHMKPESNITFKTLYEYNVFCYLPQTYERANFMTSIRCWELHGLHDFTLLVLFFPQELWAKFNS